MYSTHLDVHAYYYLDGHIRFFFTFDTQINDLKQLSEERIDDSCSHQHQQPYKAKDYFQQIKVREKKTTDQRILGSFFYMRSL